MPAYTVSTNDGELLIDKYGQQHWMLLSQEITGVGEFGGQTVIYSAELKLNLESAPPETQALVPGGGLNVLVRGVDPNRPGPQKVVYHSSFQHEPHLGVTDWVPVSVEFTVPEHSRYMQVGFLHQAVGSMSVRNPALRVCG